MKNQQTLLENLKYYFGFDTFKGDQEAIIRNLLDHKDTFVLMPTGGGKSLCYQLPALLMEGTAIVISPLIALMKNQVDAIKHISDDDNVAHFINSSLSKASITQVKDDIVAGRTKLLYVAPESLTKTEYVDFLRGIKISFYAIDEAHCISEWGHDFRPEYRNIRPIINKIGVAPIIALTATATDKVRIDIKKNLGIIDAAEFKSSFNRPNLYYEVRPKTKGHHQVYQDQPRQEWHHLLSFAQEGGGVGRGAPYQRHQGVCLPCGYGVGCAQRYSGRFPDGANRCHRSYDSLWNGYRQARRALCHPL